MVPIYAWRKVVKFLELMSFDDQERLKGRDISRLPVGSCFAYAAGQQPLFLQVPMAKERLSTRSRIFTRRLEELRAQLEALPYYQMGEKILEDRSELMKLALVELQRLQRLSESLKQPKLPPLDDPNAGGI